ncbi:glycosyltransferase [Candidatus Woesearchaeota archaeon]|nr:glycosyltransferase [Candidatus Woesearchaeota archaeon]
MTAKISIITPARNESENIFAYVKDVNKLFHKSEYTGELIIVDDASSDNTLKILKKLANKYPFLKVLHNKNQQGMTGGWMKGIKASKYDIVHLSVSDLSSLPSEDVPKMIPPLLQGYDVVIAQKEKDTRSLPKIFLSNCFAMALKILFNVNGPGWVKALKKDAFQKMPSLKHNWHRFIYPLAKSSGLKIKEVKTHFYPRYKGKSNYGKIGFSRGIDALVDLIDVKLSAMRFNKRMKSYKK